MVVLGFKSSGRKTLFQHLKYQFSDKRISNDKHMYLMTRRIDYLYFIFSFLLKHMIKKFPNHSMKDEMNSFINDENSIKIRKERNYFKNNVYPHLIKLMNDKKFREIMMEYSISFDYPDICYRLATELDLVWNLQSPHVEAVRCQYPEKTQFNPVILDKNDLFCQIQLPELDDSTKAESLPTADKYVFTFGLTIFFNPFQIYYYKRIISRLLIPITKEKKYGKLIVLFTKIDLFEALFPYNLSKFQSIFPVQFKENNITEKDYKKGLKIIEEDIYKRCEGFEIQYMNLLDPNDILSFMNIDKVDLPQNEKDLLLKDKIFLREYFFDPEKHWKFSVESIKKKNIEKILEMKSKVEYKWRDFNIEENKNLKKYKKGKIIGSGAFGQVLLCLKGENIVALKKIICKTEEELNISVAECMNGMKLDHKNILKYNDLFYNIDDEGLFMAYMEMEYYSIGNLYTFITENEIDETMIMEFSIQILEGLSYLHEKGIAHRDLKPENVLLKLDQNETDFHLSIADLGSSKKLQGSTESKVGTENYVAPEVIEGKQYNISVDMFSFGAVLFVLLFKKQKVFYVEVLKSFENTEKMIQKEFESAIFSRNNFFKDVILKCLSLNPDKRPKSKELLMSFKNNL